MKKINMIDLSREMEDIGESIIEEVSKSFSDTMFVNGPRVKEFESNIESYLGVKHAISCANGTDAILLGLLSAGVTSGDEVITTPFTFFATVEACAYIGATPVFVDIDENSLNIDATKIERAITQKTKCILPVHIFGSPANMKKIIEVAKRYDLLVVEDCAQSIGSNLKGEMAGTFGDAGTFSFYPTKNLGAYGDAGMVVTNDDEVAQKCRLYKEHGSKVRYYHDVIGYNSRLDDIQAAILNVKLKHLDRYNSKRREVAHRYKELLGEGIKYQVALEGSYHTYHQFTIRVKNRDEVIKSLNEANVFPAIFYPIPCHLQKALLHLGYKKGDLPVVDKVSEEVLSLPINPYIKDEEVKYISDIIKNTAVSL